MSKQRAPPLAARPSAQDREQDDQHHADLTAFQDDERVRARSPTWADTALATRERCVGGRPVELAGFGRAPS
jgi:hypothetical protein